jgi:glycosyltransferase involved in cell wall biosynthesis
MITKPAISVIIITHNRAALLTQCLESLQGQIKRPDEIIIIDNNSTDNIRAVIRRYQRHLPIHTFSYSRSSYPELYNTGVQHAKNAFIVFFDDDCVASSSYIHAVKHALARHPNAIIQGMTYSIPKGNMYADIMGDHYANWLKIMRIGKSNLRVFDNKNAALSKRLFITQRCFSTSMSRGSEDIEFGLRVRRHNITIVFDRRCIAYHHERTTLQDFLSQHERFARSEGYLDRHVAPSERIGMIPLKKLLLHLQSFGRRELSYILSGSYKQACLLPCIYIILAWIRITGYATSR